MLLAHRSRLRRYSCPLPWQTDGCLNHECSILTPRFALPPVIRDKNRMRFYEKVIKVKADVAALHIFFRRRCKIPGGVESCQGRRFLAFILTLDSSPRHFIIERGTKRNAVQWSFVP